MIIEIKSSDITINKKKYYSSIYEKIDSLEIGESIEISNIDFQFYDALKKRIKRKEMDDKYNIIKNGEKIYISVKERN